MPCDLAFPPRGQILVEIFQQLVGFFVERLGFLLDIHFRVGAPHGPQFFHFGFDFSQRFFELQIGDHSNPKFFYRSALYDG